MAMRRMFGIVVRSNGSLVMQAFAIGPDGETEPGPAHRFASWADFLSDVPSWALTVEWHIVSEAGLRRLVGGDGGVRS